MASKEAALVAYSGPAGALSPEWTMRRTGEAALGGGVAGVGAVDCEATICLPFVSRAGVHTPATQLYRGCEAYGPEAYEA